MGWLQTCWDVLAIVLIVRAAGRQLRRPATDYRLGASGKVVAVVGMVLFTTVGFGWIIPAGALWVLTRARPQSPVVVPMADSWPGAAPGR
jgi:hypothetical protein